MSSLTQTEFEDIMDQANTLNQDEVDNLYHEVNENYEIENYDNYYRTFNNYNEIVDMITYMHLDFDFIQDRTRDLMDALERLIARKERGLITPQGCPGCGYCCIHNCLKISCGCPCICQLEEVNGELKLKAREPPEMVSEPSKDKQTSKEQPSSSNPSRYDKLEGIKLPGIETEGMDIYDYTCKGILELEICLIHYKTQIETNVIKYIEKETNESQKEIWEQIYTMLQKV